MRKVYKYPVDVQSRPFVFLPEGAEILKFGQQNEKLWLWALVNPESLDIERTFRLLGTGDPIKAKETQSWAYIGTVINFTGSLVLHLFEVTK